MNARITAENARDFDHFSVMNASIVTSSRACNCQPYEDIFTLKRWNAQGYRVCKGEHGTHIETYAPVTRKNPTTGEEEVVGKRPWTSVVFCRCQVRRADEPGSPRPHTAYVAPQEPEPEPAPQAPEPPTPQPPTPPTQEPEDDSLFGPIISAYTPEQAIEDGYLVDLNQWIPVSESGYKWPVACTMGVWNLIEKAVKNEHHANDYKGVIWDILYMSRMMVVKRWEDGQLFRVKIVGAAKQSVFTFKIQTNAGKNGSPWLVVSLPDED